MRDIKDTLSLLTEAIDNEVKPYNKMLLIRTRTYLARYIIAKTNETYLEKLYGRTHDNAY
jgi:hypothetical protein